MAFHTTAIINLDSPCLRVEIVPDGVDGLSTRGHLIRNVLRDSCSLCLGGREPATDRDALKADAEVGVHCGGG